MVINSLSDPRPASTKTIFNIAQLVTTEKRAGLKNLHLVNLLPSVIQPLPFYLHASRAIKGPYRLRIPALSHPEIRMSMLLSQALSKRLLAAELPKGLKATKLTAKDLALVKD